MGQFFAATNPKKRSYDEMEDEEFLIEAEHVESDWYMNKMLKFKSTKVLNSSSGCASKTKSMKDLTTSSEEQLLSESQISSCSHLNEGLLDNSLRTGIKERYPLLASVQTSDDEEDIENLTLSEMKKLLRKSSVGSLKVKQENCASFTDTAPMKFESHTSRLKGIKSHENVKGISLMNTCDGEETVSKVAIISTENGVALEKKEMSDSALVMDNEDNSDESDTWTLEMWRIHKKGKFQRSRKRMKRQCMSQDSDSLSAPHILAMNGSSTTDVSKHTINTVQSFDDHILADSNVSCSQPSSSNISLALTSVGVTMEAKVGFEGNIEGTAEPTDDVASMEITDRMVEGSSDEEHRVKNSSEVEARKRTDVASVIFSGDAQLQNEFLILDQVKRDTPEKERIARNEINSSDDAQPQNEILMHEQSKQDNPDNERIQTSKVASVKFSDDASLQNEFFVLEQIKSDHSANTLSDDVQQNKILILEKIKEGNPENEIMKKSEDATINAPSDGQPQDEFLIPEQVKQDTAEMSTCVMTNKSKSNTHDAVTDGANLSELGLLCSSKGSLSHRFSEMSEMDKDITDFSECKESSNSEHFFSKMIARSEKNVAINLCNEEISSMNCYSSEIPCTDGSSPVELYTTEKLHVEEKQGSSRIQPSKIPCKRKEKLIKASKMFEKDGDNGGLRGLPRTIKCYIGRDILNQELCNVNAWTKDMAMNELSPPRKFIHKEEAMPGSPCHNRKKSLFTKCLSSKVPSLMLSNDSLQMPVKDVSTVANSSQTPPHEEFEATKSKQPPKLSPLVPAKGILKLGSPACKNACKCEECVSTRFRAERAAEFSQQQMHDIEGLTVKLLKELTTMRGVLEETLVQNMVRTQSPRTVRNLDKAKVAAHNALDVEKMARSWLVRMARDCNRYCKIMRMQERKLTFADESGGQLCQVKLFHSQERQPADNVVYPPKLSTDDCSTEVMSSSIAE